MTATVSSLGKFNPSSRSSETQQTAKPHQGYSRGRTEDANAAKETKGKNQTVFSRGTAATEKDSNRFTQALFNGLGSNAYAVLPKRVFNHLNRNAAQPPASQFSQFYLPAALPVRQHRGNLGQAAMTPPPPYSANPDNFYGNQHMPPAYSPRMGPAPMAVEPLPAYAGLELGQSVAMPNDIVVTRF